MARVTQTAVQDPNSPPIKAWSWSALNQYETCPRQTYLAKVQKVQVPKAAALEKGIRIHEQLESCLGNASIPCPPELMKIEGNLNELRSQGAIPEMEIAFNDKWEPCDWFAKDCWVRIKIDAIIPPKIGGTTAVWDWKSGKVRDDHSEYDQQLELYQLAALLAFPTADYAEAGLIFVEHGVVLECDAPMTRDMIPAAKAKWEARVKPLLSDTTFAPRPSGFACKWCDLGKAAGCEYAKDR